MTGLNSLMCLSVVARLAIFGGRSFPELAHALASSRSNGFVSCRF